MRNLLFSIAMLGISVWAFDQPKPAKPVKPVFEMSKETTVILEPLDKDGYPDYETVLNERLRGTIKPEDNACVKLWQVIGPVNNYGRPIPAAYWKWLEREAPPEKGDYFFTVIYFLIEKGKTDNFETIIETEHRLTVEPWSATEQPDFAAWLKAIEKPLNNAVDAVQKKSFFSPSVYEKVKESQFEIFVPFEREYREIGKALLIRAMLRTRQKQYDDAWKDLQACHRLARHISHGSTFDDWLVGIEIELQTCLADLAFLKHAEPKGESLVRYRNDLDALPPLATAEAKMELGERFALLNLIVQLRRDGIDSPINLTPFGDNRHANRKLLRTLDEMTWSDTFRIVNRWHDRVANIMRIADRPSRMKAWKEYESEAIAWWNETATSVKNWEKDFQNKKVMNDMGNIVGKILVSFRRQSSQRFEQFGEQGIQTFSITKLAFALAAYREAKGEYPDKLDQLAPTHIKTVPVDLYTGKELIYRKSEKGYIVYSVGLNEKDDGGFLISDGPKVGKLGNDIGVRMPGK